MKQIYNVIKEPICNHVKKEFSKDALKLVSNLSSDFNSLEIKDKIDVGLNRLSEKQSFTYKPSFVGKNIDEYNGFNNRIYRSFSTKVERMSKFADPTNDVAFKKIFSEDNIDGIKNFVESVTSNAKDFPFSTKFTSIEFLNKDHMPGIFKGKKSLCDLKVQDDKGNTYIIEMQKRNEQDYLQRIQYYSAHAITDQLEQGVDHTEINPVITISIMSKQQFSSDVPCISYHPFKETVTNRQLLNAQSHIFIELPKLDKSNLKESTLEWLQLFKDAQKLEDAPEVKNTYVKEAYHKLEQHNWNSEDKKAYIDAKIADDMEKSNIKHAIDEGISIGKTKGINEEKIKIAINLKRTNVDPKIISEATGLSIEEISKL